MKLPELNKAGIDRKKAEESLTYRIQIESLIASISAHFINIDSDKIDIEIYDALKTVGEFVHVDRSYMFMFSDDSKSKLDNTHEWCAEGIEPQIQNLKGITIESLPWWMAKLNRFENIHIPCVADLPLEAGSEKAILEAQSIKSLIAVPMTYKNSLIGFIGFDSVRVEKVWPEEDIRMFQMIGQVFANVLERKRSEELLHEKEHQLRHAQKIEAVGQLAGGIAHDFNNVLTAIIGYASVLSLKMKEDDPLRINVEAILASTERATSLTRGLLTFSRKQLINPVPLNLNDIIRRVENILSRVIGEDVVLRTVLADENMLVLADCVQIEQVLINLVNNSRDAMPDGGELIINTHPVMIGSDFIKKHGFGKEGMYALISVVDTGIGMDEKTKEKIFEPFYTTKEVGKGTGLGLSIVYGIIAQHNGYIDVYSKPGEGAIFNIYLPIVKQRRLDKKEKEIYSAPSGGTESLLIAEDDAEVRILLKVVLTEHGYSVIEAVDGNDAVAKFMENRDRIKLLILDVVMPEKNGKDVYEEIQQTSPDIKVLFVSGYAQDVIQRRGLIEEERNYLAKPIFPHELLVKVREILDH